MADKMDALRHEINKVVKGKSNVVDKVLCAMLAGGHILLEDIPGVGKTTLAVTVARAMDLSYRRVQFTPDVLPSDIVGFSMFNSQTRQFEYREGAIFANLFLADEINRTSPKTQSALLEAMEEEKVTVDGMEHPLPSPFTVIATENPIGSSGTQMLPESQLDRFMICLSMGYPEHGDAVQILKNDGAKPLRDVQRIVSAEEWAGLREKAASCYVSDELYDYVVRLTEATRASRYLVLGASPRASIALMRMSKAMAVLNGREYLIPEDVQKVYYDVFAHRVKLDTMARAEGMSVVIEFVFLFGCNGVMLWFFRGYVNLVIAAGMLVFLVYALVSVHIVKRYVTLDLEIPVQYMTKNIPVCVKIKLENRCIFPIVNCRVRLYTGNVFAGQTVQNDLIVPARPLGTTVVDYPLRSSCVGNVEITVDGLILEDVLMFHAVSKSG